MASGAYSCIVPCRDSVIFLGSFFGLFGTCADDDDEDDDAFFICLTYLWCFFSSLSLGSMGISDWSGDHGIIWFSGFLLVDLLLSLDWDWMGLVILYMGESWLEA